VVALSDSAYALGPALVLTLAGVEAFGWGHWPLYVAAFAAQVVFDVGCGFGRTWFEERVPISQLTPMAWIYATDACLSSAGLLIAASAQRRPGLVLLALPLIALFGLFARERTERMDNTLALSTAYRGTAMLLGDVIEDDDEYTGVHSRAVVDLSLAVAGRLGLDATARRNVEFGALLHDVGKIRVPKEIIRKPGKLNDEEWAIMREHTVFGEQMLRQVGGALSSVGKVVRHSHERYDGTGYPDGLAGEAIPIESRIVSACDAFNAMTTDRPYRRAMSLEAAIAELKRCSATHFDPHVIVALLAELTEHPPVVVPPPAARVPAPAPAVA
jgi:putative nucleotidyltransferase with HDIG domain